MKKASLFLLLCTLFYSQTVRFSAGYDLGLHLGSTEEEPIDKSISAPMKSLLDGGNGISFDVAFITAAEKDASGSSMFGLRLTKATYNGKPLESEDNTSVLRYATTGNIFTTTPVPTEYVGKELQVTTITPYFGMRGGSDLLKGYFTLGLTIINYKWQYDNTPYFEFQTGIGGHLGIGADLNNLGGTGIGLNAEIGFQFAWSGTEAATNSIQAINKEWNLFWTNHMFTVRAGAVYTIDFF